jgi:predicted alpha/beta superfamily hydrolase
MPSTPQRWTLAAGLLLFVTIAACATPAPITQPDPETPGDAFPLVALPGTELRTLQSSHTGRDYDIYIRFPESYASGDQTYPTLYVLDGQWDFKLLDSIQGGLYFDGFTPEMLIVGITYSGEEPNYEVLRAMDYTPVRANPVLGSGDAPKFYDFIEQELIPFVESGYRADPSHRVLMGSSYGGLFTLYALFRQPELFQGYISASPAVPYGNRFAFDQEADYAESRDDLPVRLFLSVGSIEQLAYPVEEFARILEEREYDGLQLEYRVIEGERHAGNKPEAYNRGLRFVFAGR